MKKNKSKIKKKNKSRKSRRRVDKKIVLKEANLNETKNHYTSTSSESVLSVFERLKDTIDRDRKALGR